MEGETTSKRDEPRPVPARAAADTAGGALDLLVAPADAPAEVRGLIDRARQENETLYAVINTVSSSLDLESVLAGIVDIATTATDCHACFVYFLEEGRLVLRAASPMYAGLVGKVEMGVEEGLTGWVARNREPEFIRENALGDPRMKFVPELEEEQFQSMVAVPVPARSGDVIGVIVLHTAAPHEFEEEVLNFLVHTASLVAGAIENAQLYEEARRRVDALTTLSALSQELAAVTLREDLYRVVTGGVPDLLGADLCQIFLFEGEAGELLLVASNPDDAPRPAGRGAALLLDLLRGHGARGRRGTDSASAATAWPGYEDAALLTAPLVVADERLGLICCLARGRRAFTDEQEELFRAVANQAAVGLKKAEVIERLTAENIVRDLFEALAEGAVDVARAKAAAAECDLSRPHVFVAIEPAPEPDGRDPDRAWPQVAESLEARLRRVAPSSFFDVRRESMVALVHLKDPGEPLALRQACDDLAGEEDVVVGISAMRTGAAEGRRSLREAADAVQIGSALKRGGGAIAYEELGAYKYLVHLALDDAPHDRHWDAVERLLDYDTKRRTQLVDTLEQFLRDRRSVAATARALYIHPNTLRQRLDRIEKLSGLEMADEDLLSLELAVKLVRLHHASDGLS